MIEFYNLHPNFYKKVKGKDGKEYWQDQEIITIGDGDSGEEIDVKRQVSDMEKEAIDILEINSKIKQAEKEEKEHTISNISPDDSLEELVFKMFE